MLDRDDQRALLQRLAKVAGEEGYLVAPVGSVFYIFFDGDRALTKDIDAVVHDPGLGVADVRALERIGARLGVAERTHDGAVVAVRTRAGLTEPDIELVRGRRRRKGGFMPRDLLMRAARHATREGNLLIYPAEFVLVLKADAAIDREERALGDPAHAERNRIRADVFRADVFREAARLNREGGAGLELLEEALGCLKRRRERAVRDLLEAAGLPVGMGEGSGHLLR